MIARDTNCVPRIDHLHRYSQDPWNVGTAIHQVAEKHYLASIWMAPVRTVVAQLRQQRLKFAPTALNVTDDVEWAVVALAIAPKRLPFDSRRFDRVGRIQNVNV